MLTSEEVRSTIKAAVVEAFKDPTVHCRYGISPEEHTAQHAALKNFMLFTEKINGIKWKTGQTIIVMVVMWLFMMMVFGAYVKLKIMTWFGF
jgi:hypothetical protein